jgi:hypothetical protein
MSLEGRDSTQPFGLDSLRAPVPSQASALLRSCGKLVAPAVSSVAVRSSDELGCALIHAPARAKAHPESTPWYPARNGRAAG